MNAVLRRIAVWSVFCLSSSFPVHAAETYLDFQSGSLMGMGHLSYGVRLADRHNLQAGVGYVPKRSDHAEMTLFSLRYRYDSGFRWSVAGLTLNPLSLGTSLLIGNHRELFVRLPDRYPDDYYMPSALRLVFNYQATLELTPQWQAFADISALDVGVLGYVREPEFYNKHYDFLGLDGITYWGLGVRYVF